MAAPGWRDDTDVPPTVGSATEEEQEYSADASGASMSESGLHGPSKERSPRMVATNSMSPRGQPSGSNPAASPLAAGRVLTEADVVRLRQLQMFAQGIDARIEAERRTRLQELKDQHAQFTTIVGDLRQKHEVAVSERNQYLSRAEAAERKCELLAAKLASMVRRRGEAHGDEVKAATQRVIEEREGLVEEVVGFADDLGVDATILCGGPNGGAPSGGFNRTAAGSHASGLSLGAHNTSAAVAASLGTDGFSGIPVTLADATVVVQCLRAEVTRQRAMHMHAMDDARASLVAASEALAKCHVLATRKLRGGSMGWVADGDDDRLDDFSSVQGSSIGGGRPPPAPPSRRGGHKFGADSSGGAGFATLASMADSTAGTDDDGGASDYAAGGGGGPDASTLDAHMVAAFRTFITDSLVELSRVSDVVKARLEGRDVAPEGDAHARQLEQQQAAMRRLATQLQREVARHAESRNVARSMLEAAESQQVELLHKMCAINGDTLQTHLDSYNAAITAAADDHARQQQQQLQSQHQHQQRHGNASFGGSAVHFDLPADGGARHAYDVAPGDSRRGRQSESTSPTRRSNRMISPRY